MSHKNSDLAYWLLWAEESVFEEMAICPVFSYLKQAINLPLRKMSLL
jgi:hypothetical protein